MQVTATGDAIWFIDNLAQIRIGGEETDGRLAVVELSARRGHMPPLHVHRNEDEAFVLLDGRITVYVGDDVAELGPGATAFAPKDVPHTFRVESDEARWLAVAAPAGFEAFVAAVGRAADEPVIPAELVLPTDMSLEEIAAEFGIEVLGPPGALPS